MGIPVRFFFKKTLLRSAARCQPSFDAMVDLLEKIVLVLPTLSAFCLIPCLVYMVSSGSLLSTLNQYRPDETT